MTRPRTDPTARLVSAPGGKGPNDPGGVTRDRNRRTRPESVRSKSAKATSRRAWLPVRARVQRAGRGPSPPRRRSRERPGEPARERTRAVSGSRPWVPRATEKPSCSQARAAAMPNASGRKTAWKTRRVMVPSIPEPTARSARRAHNKSANILETISGLGKHLHTGQRRAGHGRRRPPAPARGGPGRRRRGTRPAPRERSPASRRRAEGATHSLAPGKPGWPPTSIWPLFSHPTPHVAVRRDRRGQAVRKPSPAGYCLLPNAEFPKTERDPISTSRPSISLCVAHPLTVLSWPEAPHASGSRRACLMHISRNTCSPVALPDFPEFAQAVRYGVPGTQRGYFIVVPGLANSGPDFIDEVHSAQQPSLSGVGVVLG